MSDVIFEDLKPRRVVGWDSRTGNILVKDNDSIIEMEMFVNAQGKPFYKRPEPAPIDQLGEVPKTPLAERWAKAGIDQG